MSALGKGANVALDAGQVRALIAAPELLDAASADDLAVAERLRRDWPADLVAAASEQAELRSRAAAKFALASSMLLTRGGLEQATSEPVARHRAARIAASGVASVLDLCCGLGGDLLALAAAVEGPALGVDRDETHAVCAQHNARLYGADHAAVAVADVRDIRFPDTRAAAVFVDPARRSAHSGRRGGSAPPLEWCVGLPTAHVCVKAAPGLDRDVVPAGWETEFVADGRALKEAVLWSPAWATAQRRATVIATPAATGSAPRVETLVADPSAPAADVRAPGRYLLDPSPAVTRAGAVADLAALVGGWQVDRQIAFLSADEPLRSPFGRALAVEASLPFGVKALAAELRRLDVAGVDFRRRGLAGDVDLLRRRLMASLGTRTASGRVVTVVLTRVVNKPWAFVCSDVDAP